MNLSRATLVVLAAVMIFSSGCAGYLRPEPTLRPPEQGGIKLNDAGATCVEVLGEALNIAGPFLVNCR